MRKAVGHPRLRRRPTVLLQLVLVFLICGKARGRESQDLISLVGVFQRVDILELALHNVGARGDNALDRFTRGLDLLLGAAQRLLIARQLGLDSGTRSTSSVRFCSLNVW